MLIEDFKVKARPLPRVRLHPHFACQDCRYVKELWRECPEVRTQIVLNGIKPCKSRLKAKYMKEVPPKKSLLEVLSDIGKEHGRALALKDMEIERLIEETEELL